jgi:biopolymer transport protein ExbD
MKKRRLRKEVAHLEVTAFINLIVVLVPFLLSTAVFTRLAVMELSLPAQTSGIERLEGNDLKLEIVLRPDAIEVGDRIGGLIKRIDNVNGRYDAKTLEAVLHELKTRFPDKTDATLLAQPETPYEHLVQVMDTVRSGKAAQDGKLVRVELFPQISIGDAPVKTVASR